MSELITERSGAILRAQWNRPAKKNALTAGMYLGLADLLNAAAKDDRIRVVLLHGAGDSFTAGNDLEDFANHPPGPGESPQAKLCDALLNFDRPLIAAVHGFAVGSGTTMLTYCDFVYAGESAKFQMPFINLALVPEFGSSYSFPARFGYLRAVELVLLGMPFDAVRAAAIGLVTQVVPDGKLLATATETAQKLAEKPALFGRARSYCCDLRTNRLCRPSRLRTRNSPRGCTRPTRAKPSKRSFKSVHRISAWRAKSPESQCRESQGIAPELLPRLTSPAEHSRGAADRGDGHSGGRGKPRHALRKQIRDCKQVAGLPNLPTSR